jgi:hypothetical protein
MFINNEHNILLNICQAVFYVGLNSAWASVAAHGAIAPFTELQAPALLPGLRGGPVEVLDTGRQVRAQPQAVLPDHGGEERAALVALALLVLLEPLLGGLGGLADVHESLAGIPLAALRIELDDVDRPNRPIAVDRISLALEALHGDPQFGLDLVSEHERPRGEVAPKLDQMPPQPLRALAFPQRLEPLGRLLDRDADVEIRLSGIAALDNVIELDD